MATKQSSGRRHAVGQIKRKLILDAARTVFEAEGLEGASLRAIAAEAGYTPAALYFHFDSKEAIYAELLRRSLADLEAAVKQAAARPANPSEQLRAAALAFFRYYETNPRDLDLGFYLFRGGTKPHGLGKDRDRVLNTMLVYALRPIRDAFRNLGATPAQARRMIVEIFAYATGMLLLANTGRIRLFGAAAGTMMAGVVDRIIAELTTPKRRGRGNT